ncbi:MAG TPA: STAS/SEC14 domain-containing protein [Usitatibacter sp.]|nr:STAS/SEC14 domain-containing protein [Usitatibacter sp.]
MIEILEGFPNGVVALSAKGRVSKRDYETALVPQVEHALRGAGKIRCYYELGPEFSGMDPGAAWEDFKVGVEHLRRWERVAVVTDVDWIRRGVDIFRFPVPGDFRVFPAARAAEARRWIGEASRKRAPL